MLTDPLVSNPGYFPDWQCSPRCGRTCHKTKTTVYPHLMQKISTASNTQRPVAALGMHMTVLFLERSCVRTQHTRTLVIFLLITRSAGSHHCCGVAQAGERSVNFAPESYRAYKGLTGRQKVGIMELTHITLLCHHTRGMASSTCENGFANSKYCRFECPPR